MVNAYRRMLEWEIAKQPRGMKVVERAASPVLGKSYIVYTQKPDSSTSTDTSLSRTVNGHVTVA